MWDFGFYNFFSKTKQNKKYKFIKAINFKFVVCLSIFCCSKVQKTFHRQPKVCSSSICKCAILPWLWKQAEPYTHFKMKVQFWSHLMNILLKLALKIFTYVLLMLDSFIYGVFSFYIVSIINAWLEAAGRSRLSQPLAQRPCSRQLSLTSHQISNVHCFLLLSWRSKSFTNVPWILELWVCWLRWRQSCPANKVKLDLLSELMLYQCKNFQCTRNQQFLHFYYFFSFIVAWVYLSL